MRLFQQGHWVEENHKEWVNTYDISTPEKAKTIGLAAFRLYLNRYHRNNYPAKVYTLGMHKKKWTWRGGDVFDATNVNNKRAWDHYESEKKGHETKADKFYEALEAFEAGNGEFLIEFLNGFDDIHLCFHIITVKEEFDGNPTNDSGETACEQCGDFNCDCEGQEDQGIDG